MNNIKVDQSAIGVLSIGSITGSLQNIDATITVLKNDHTMQALQKALSEFTEAVIKSTEASNEQKTSILELVSALADEARKPKDKRRNAVAKTILQRAQDVVSAIATLKVLWQTLEPIIAAIFS